MNPLRPGQGLPPQAIARFFALSQRRHLFLVGGCGDQLSLMQALLPLLGEGPWAVSKAEEGPLDENGADFPEAPAALAALLEAKRVLAALPRSARPGWTALLAREDVCALDLDAPYPLLGCVVMASGLGQRFGGNKLMAPLEDKPLLAWVLEATQGVFARRVVVTRSPQTAAFCRAWGAEVLLHALPARSDTVALGLRALGSGLAGCAFCQGDQPLVSRQSLFTLALAAQRWPLHILRLAWAGQGGAPVLFPAPLLGELAALPPGSGGGHVIRTHPHQVRLVPAQAPQELWDVDSQEDLARFLPFLPKDFA